MPDLLDIFHGELFTMATLTDAINTAPYRPDFLDTLNLFQEEGIATRQVIIEEDAATLILVPTAPYGGVPAIVPGPKRKARSFIVPHIPTMDAIHAEELQNVRAYATNGSTSAALMSVQQLRDRKLLNMRSALEATLEYHRMGAVKGLILDADGTTVLLDLFAEFQVTQQTVAMDLVTPATNVLGKIRTATRLSLDALGADTATGFIALCSDSFFDKLIAHANVEKHYLNWNAAAAYSQSHRTWGVFEFGGVSWYNYRGTVAGIPFIPAGKAYLIPTGTRKLFLAKFAPADYIDRVNQIPSMDGIPIEVRSEMIAMGKGLSLEAQSNPLFLCTKPRAIILLNEGATLFDEQSREPEQPPLSREEYQRRREAQQRGEELPPRLTEEQQRQRDEQMRREEQQRKARDEGKPSVGPEGNEPRLPNQGPPSKR